MLSDFSAQLLSTLRQKCCRRTGSQVSSKILLTGAKPDFPALAFNQFENFLNFPLWVSHRRGPLSQVSGWLAKNIPLLVVHKFNQLLQTKALASSLVHKPPRSFRFLAINWVQASVSLMLASPSASRPVNGSRITRATWNSKFSGGVALMVGMLCDRPWSL